MLGQRRTRRKQSAFMRTQEYLRSKASTKELKNVLNLAFAKKYIKAVEANYLIQKLLEAIIIDDDLEEDLPNIEEKAGIEKGKEKEIQTVTNTDDSPPLDPLSQDQSLTQAEKILRANEKAKSTSSKKPSFNLKNICKFYKNAKCNYFIDYMFPYLSL